MNTTAIVASVLRHPPVIRDFDPSHWSELVRQARAAEMLGQLRATIHAAGMIPEVPARPLHHLEVGWRLSLRHRSAVDWEVRHVRDALGELGLPVILLKGAAYCVAGYRAAEGRVFNDIDFLVPKASLPDVEIRLIRRGWLPATISDYDQRYYRNWSHELPPMDHRSRGTVLDVHHTIVPPVSGILPDPDALIRSASPVDVTGLEMFSVLAPPDMVIHSACHLFLGEFHKGLRDLYDLHVLMTDFGREESFWTGLQARAVATGLALPTLDAMTQAHRVFGTAVPEDVMRGLRAQVGAISVPRVRAWMFDKILRPPHPSCDTRVVRFARWLAFVRSHWLRMPLPLLVYHLGHKALKGDAH
ncbi:MAG TPA: nucleotidyltransferase family protein [Rhodocyclaceae bacterium]|nr:nucleotidyltransferase family protein [Rhodocyclaceae bacterium]HRQ45549.1 nucleotidyltransferase family protein [Rhodocyclaceae bacterium]